MGFLQNDTTILRVLLFVAMSLVFLLFLQITERRHDKVMSQDSVANSQDSTAGTHAPVTTKPH